MFRNDKELSQKDKEDKINRLRERILSEIELFTVDKQIYEKEIGDIEFSKISWDEENKNYNYKIGNSIIMFKKLSDDIEIPELKKELVSFERYEKCHERLLILLNIMNKPAILLNGTYISRGKKCLHSVIKLQSKEKNEIIDYTKNLIMPEQQYMELTQFNVIEAIKDTEHIEDIREGIENHLIKMGSRLKPYFMFRKELKVDIERNRQFLTKVDNKELIKREEEIQQQRGEFEKY